MPELSPEIVDQVVEACQDAVADVADALKRSLDCQLDPSDLSVGEPGTLDPKTRPDAWDDAGLVVVLTVNDTAALVLFPEHSGLLPTWYTAPDQTGQSKLGTLAQELGLTLLPMDYSPSEFKAVAVANLAETVADAQVSDAAAMVPLELQTPDGKTAVAYLIWPVKNPAGVVPAESPVADEKSETVEPTQASETAEPSVQTSVSAPPEGPMEPSAETSDQSDAESSKHEPLTIQSLPTYTRSLLRIKVPVAVTLARKQQHVERILELGPGSIIQFDKSCEEMLELDIGGRPIAKGEAVKVGEKFGLRIHSIILPDERFRRVTKDAAGELPHAAGKHG